MTAIYLVTFVMSAVFLFVSGH